MSVDVNIYDARFFTNAVKLEAPSARAVADILNKHFAPRSVIDVGCGCGVYLAEFKKRGVKILGYDGSPAALKASLVGAKIKLRDLCRPLPLKQKFDLCLCLEVAEHLPLLAADTLINTLVKSAPTIVFTAATPGQGPRSIGHINEQPHSFWVKKFQAQQYSLDKKLTAKIKREMKARKVIWWIVKNLTVFKHSRGS